MLDACAILAFVEQQTTRALPTDATFIRLALAVQDLVDPILAKGANPTAVNGVGICPLHYTCYSDSLSLDAAEALLWRGADPCAAETTYGCTPLHYAASSGDADLCTLLVEHGAQPQASITLRHRPPTCWRPSFGVEVRVQFGGSATVQHALR